MDHYTLFSRCLWISTNEQLVSVEYMLIVQILSQSSPTNVYQEEHGLAAMLAAKRSAGVAPEVNIRECVRHTPLPSMNRAAHSGFETQRRCHQKFKIGVLVASQKGLMSSKI